MGNLSKRPKIIKLLNVGVSGTGKTGALASLLKAGYKVDICDFDNGCDIFYDPGILPPEFRDNLWIHTFYDEAKFAQNGNIIYQKSTAFPRFCRHMATGTEDCPPLAEKDDSWITVIDSLTFLGNACLRHTLFQEGRGNDRPQIQDWGAAQELQEGVLEGLQSPSTKCHIIVNAHVKMAKDPAAEEDIRVIERPGKPPQKMDLTPKKAQPYALGQALPPKVGSYFNSLLVFESNNRGRTIQTQMSSILDVKTILPTVLPAELKIEDGLAKVFEAVVKGA